MDDFDRAEEIPHRKDGFIVQDRLAGEPSEDLVLIGQDQFQVHAGFSVKDRAERPRSLTVE